MSVHVAIIFAGMLLDRLVGDPDWLWRRWSHPVVLIGRSIDRLDRVLNRRHFSPGLRKAAGIAAIALLVGAGLFLGIVATVVCSLLGPVGWVPEAVLLAIFLAHKSLVDHVRKVATSLERRGLESGRRSVAMIVGRDPDQLDEAGVCRAAIESLAENASDGVVAPLFWFAILGLPGLFAYKAINTADSMIGHLSETYRDFGWAAARLDDLVNWPAARLTAGLFAAAMRAKNAFAGTTGPGMRQVLAQAHRDALSHRSPNAGWPEGAMAAALGLSLGGPRRYRELVVDAPLLNPEGRHDAEPADIAAAIALFETAMTLALAAAAVAWLVLWV